MTQIDTGALLKLREVIGGDAKDLQEFIGDFNDIAPQLVATMFASVESCDWNGLKIASHSLKSNSRDFGANALSQLCMALEQESAEGQVDDASSKIEKINAETKDAITALNSLDLNSI